VFEAGTLDERRVGGVGRFDGVVARYDADGAFRGAISMKVDASADDHNGGAPALAMAPGGAVLAAARFSAAVAIGLFVIPAPSPGPNGLVVTRLDLLDDAAP
jgi:hypothetical protein